MKLSYADRERILDAAFDWLKANGSKTGECWCFFHSNHPDNTFQVRVESVARVNAPVLANETFGSVAEALRYFAPVRQLALFEVEQ